jgi:phosphatidylethanolamine-binding protein
VLDDFIPSASLTIAWPYKKTDDYNITTELGNTIAPSKLQSPPNAYLDVIAASSPATATTKGPAFVLTMTDPDAPSRDDPKWSEMCHWIAAVKRSKSGKAKAHEVVEYKPPGPPKKTGKHRYVFTVWVAANR